MENNQIVTRAVVSEATGVALDSPSNKLVTYEELQNAINQMPKANGNIVDLGGSEQSFQMMFQPSPGGYAMIVDNAGKSRTRVTAAYSTINLDAGMMGGHGYIQNASGYDTPIVLTDSVARPVAWRLLPTSSGFQTKLYAPGSYSYKEDFRSGWRFNFNDDYALKYGTIYVIWIS